MLAGPHAGHFRGILHSMCLQNSMQCGSSCLQLPLAAALLDNIPERRLLKRRSTFPTVKWAVSLVLAPNPRRTCGFIALDAQPKHTFLVVSRVPHPGLSYTHRTKGIVAIDLQYALNEKVL